MQLITSTWSTPEHGVLKDCDLAPSDELHAALYCSNDETDLHEVMFMVPTPRERVPILRRALHHDLEHVRFHATLLLVAWGDQEGLDSLGLYLVGPTTSRGRLIDRDLFLDELGDALLSGVELGNVSWRQAAPYVQQLLARYSTQRFSGRFVGRLSESYVAADVVPHLIAAIDHCITIGEFRQASRLVRPLAHHAPEAAWSVIERFESRPGQRRQYGFEVTHALALIPGSRSQALAQELGAEGYAPHPMALRR